MSNTHKDSPNIAAKEAAKQRVRAEVASMQKSDDIVSVLKALWTELHGLGLEFDWCGFTTYFDDGESVQVQGLCATEVWEGFGFPVASREVLEGVSYTVSAKVPQTLPVWKSDMQSSVRGSVAEADRETTVRHLANLWGREPEFDPSHIGPDGGLQISRAAAGFIHGHIDLQRLARDAFAESDGLLLQEFGEAISLGYSRYLDFQKLEAQNRQLQVEAALERVRGAALAMKTTDDLEEATAVMFREMQGLSQPVVRFGVLLVTEEEDLQAWEVWTWGSEGVVSRGFHAPFDSHPVTAQFSATWKDRQDAYVELEGEALESWYRYMIERLGFPAESLKRVERYCLDMMYFSRGYLYAVASERLDVDDLNILRKFRDGFAFAYGRYLELAEKERQNRELQVEGALERVRAAALAMQTSDDLEKAAGAMFEELQGLSLPFVRSGVTIADETADPPAWEFWTRSSGGMVSRGLHVPLREHPLFDEACTAWKAGEDYLVFQLEGEPLKEYLGYLRGQGYPAEWPDDQPYFVTPAFFGQGFLFVVSSRSLGEDSLNVLRKFRDGFAFAYNRYLELAEKERQNRELQVEAALERVRAAALAMQTSDDLQEATGVLHKELNGLSLRFERSGVGIAHESAEEWEFWTWDAEGLFSPGVQVPFHEYPVWDGVSTAWKQGEESHLVELQGEPLQHYLRYLNSRGYPATWPDGKDYRFHLMYFPHGSLYVVTAEHLSGEDLNVVRKFRDGFSFAYNRYLELAEKERQNRELLVEGALERVRAAALAMQTSNDLEEAASVLFQELQGLSLPIIRSGVGIADEDTKPPSWELWGWGSDGVVSRGVHIPFHEHAAFDEMTRAWRNDEDIHLMEFEGEPLQKYLSYLQDKHGHRVDGPDDEHEYLNYCILFAHGSLYVVVAERLGDEDLNVIRKFRDGFAFAYNRYLELAEKERQNRELQVQGALERVRAAALAMQTSNDLEEAAGAMFEELQGLSLPILRSGIAIANEEDDPPRLELWARNEEGLISRGTHFPFHEHPAMKGLYPAWKRGDDSYLMELDGEPMQDWLRYMRDLGYPLEWPEHLGVYRNHCVNFPHGLLYAVAPERLGDDDLNVLRKFRDGFAFAYNRYLELAEKERQNRELSVEAALERVRGRALAMESEEDLNGVAYALFEELEGLKYGLLRSTMNVHDLDGGTASSWMAMTGMVDADLEGVETVYAMPKRHTPDVSDFLAGKTDLPEAMAPEIRARMEAWRAGERSIHQRRDKADTAEHGGFFAYVRNLLTKERPDLEKAIGWEGGPDTEEHYSFFNEHGWIQVVSPNEFSDEQVATATRFADLFAFAYSRFKELDAKQKANRELSVEAALERVRGKALAMEAEEDLNGVAFALFEELEGLDYGLLRSTIDVFDIDGGTYSSWMAMTGMVDADLEGVETMYARPIQHLPFLSDFLSGKVDWPEDYPPEVRDRMEAWRAKERFIHQHRVDVSAGPSARLRKRLSDDRPDLEQAISWERRSDTEEFYYFFNEHGSVQAASTKEFSDEQIATATRFADLFAFAYSRFKELNAKQKANRELAVEATLERVRSRAQGMQRSEEIADVVATMREQFTELGIPIRRHAICVFDLESDRGEIWTTTVLGEPLDVCVSNLDAWRSPGINHSAELLDAIAEGDLSPRHDTYSREEVEENYRYLRDRLNWTVLFDRESTVAIPDRNEYYIHPFPNGWLSLASFEELSSEQVATVQRFADIFGFAYDRFQELKRLEAQNRELQVEAAMERVRARAQGMQESEEIADVAVTMWEQFSDLGIPIRRSNIMVVDLQSDTGEIWSTTTHGEPVDVAVANLEAWRTPGVFHSAEALDTLTRGDLRPQHYTHAREELERNYQYLRDHLNWSVPLEQEASDELPERIENYLHFFPDGLLFLSTYEEIPDEQVATVQRFADIFGFAYDRFQELKRLEAQNRDLQVEAALERVRARAQGMQESEEIAGVAATLFDEFQGLGFELIRTAVSIRDDKNRTLSYWTGSDTLDPDSPRRFSRPAVARHLDDLNDAFRARYEQSCEDREAGKPHYVFERDAEEIRTHLLDNRQSLLDSGMDPDLVDRIEAKSTALTSEAVHWVFHSHGSVVFALERLLTEDELAVAKRFSDVFGFAYGRFLELDAKETQNRELTIENAVDRVQARALGMQESAEISDVASSLRDEFEGLGREISSAVIAIPDEAAGTLKHWFATALMSQGAETGTQPLDSGVRSYGRWKAGEPWVDPVDREHLANQVRAIHESAGASEADIQARIESLPDEPYVNGRSFGPGWINFVTSAPFTEEDVEVAGRFADVFSFAYSRFRELEEKEEQNRELRIANALEGVRARALGMQESDELSDVTSVLFEQFRELGHDVRAAVILVENEESGVREWWAEYADGRRLHRKFTASAAPGSLLQRTSQETRRARLAGEPWNVLHLEGEDLLRWVRELHETVGSTEQEIEDALALVPEKATLHRVFHERGLIEFGLQQRLSDDDLAVAKRFTDVFDFAYGRFLELKQKEEQNRELTIQNALERVRAQALGMQASDDLQSVVVVLHEQFKSLGIKAIVTSIEIVDRENEWVQNTAFVGPNGASPWMTIPFETYRTIPLNVRILEAYLRGDAFLNSQMEGEEYRAFIKFWLDISDIEAPDSDFPERHSSSAVFFSRGWVYLELGDAVGERAEPNQQALEVEPLSEDDLAMVRRFADMFDFAYSRFLELKEKEAQNRELTIQNAIERVRSRALGMQESSELSEVSYVLSKELSELVQGYLASSLITIDEEARVLYDHQQLPGWAPGEVLPVVRFEIDEIDPSAPIAHVKEAYEARARGEAVYTREFNSEDTVAIIKWINRYYEEHYPDAGLRLPETAPDDVTYICVMSTSGYLEIARVDHGRFSDDEVDLTKRFADVFDFAYSRFLELKEKEDQNRELTIQNALERVRARALGMQESRELAEVSQTLSAELQALIDGVVASSIGIVDDKRNIVEVAEHFPDWVGNEALPTFRLVVDEIETTSPTWHWKEVFEARSRGETTCTITWDTRKTRALFDWYNRYWDEHHPEIEYRLSLPEGEGEGTTVHVMNATGFIDVTHLVLEPFREGDIAVIKRFGAAFDFAYSRFLELKEKEDQNRELTIQNALERVRAQAQGMQESSELYNVVGALTDEIHALGIPAEGCAIMLVDREAGVVRWSTRRGGVALPWQTVSIEAMRSGVPWNSRALDAHERGDAYLYEDLGTEEGQAQLKFWIERLLDANPDHRQRGVPVRTGRTRLYNFNFKHGFLHLDLTHSSGTWGEPDYKLTEADPLTEDEVETVLRFTEVFDYAYGRFRELEEKEAQNRELTIQNALERVRAQAQGMQASDEIAGVAMAIYEQFQGLGYGLYRADVMITHDEDEASVWSFGDSLHYREGLSDEELNSRKPYLGHLDDEEGRRLLEARARGDWHFKLVLEGDELDAFRRTFALPEGVVEAWIESGPEVEVYDNILHSHGFISFVRTEALLEEDLQVAKRFTDVFDYAYDRFQELKEKEEQNRELIIQNAVERVQSRALGMQESSELDDVSFTLRNELGDLIDGFAASSIGTVDEDAGIVMDSQQYGYKGEMMPAIRWPALDEIEPTSPMWHMKSIIECRDRGETAFRMAWDMAHLEAVFVWFRHYYEEHHPDVKFDFKPVGDASSSVWVMSTTGWIACHRANAEAFDDTDVGVIKRLADVFDFAYARYLELKEKEDQNRELTIQNAVERVQSRALGMQESTDLFGVSETLFNEWMSLGFAPWQAVVTVVGPDQEWVEHWCWNQVGGAWYSGRKPLGARLKEDIAEARAKGERALFVTNDGASYALALRQRMEEDGKSQDEIDAAVADAPETVYVTAVGSGEDGFQRVSLNVDSADRHLTEDEIAVVSRFSDVFELAYGRFLELKQKEEQNRELTIANAIERVRSRALGMQESEELAGVTSVLHEEWNNLRPGTIGANIVILDREQEMYTAFEASIWSKELFGREDEEWVARPGRTGSMEELRAQVPWLDDLLEAADEGRSHHLYELEDAEESERAWLESEARAEGRDEKWVEETLARIMERVPDVEYHSCFFFSNGLLHSARGESPSEGDIALGIRFAQAFDFAYKRFTELKAKEEQNRELTVANAIERVRARALGMQESSELDEVSIALFDALGDIGIERVASWISIIDEDASQMQTSIQVEGAQQLVSTQQSLSEWKEWDSEAGSKLDSWRRRDAYLLSEMRGDERKAGFDAVQSQLAATNPGFAFPEDYPETYFVVDTWNRYGAVGFGRFEPIDEEEAQVVKRFADVFQFAYSRFLELKQKEDQNRELTIANAIERVRARALGMQEGDDLVHVSRQLFSELKELSIPAAISSIGVLADEEGQVFRVAPTIDAGPLDWFTVPREAWMANATLAESLASWDRGDPWWTKRIEGDEAVTFDRFWDESGGVGGPRTEATIAAVWFSRGWLYMDLAHPKDGADGQDGEMVAADPLDEEQLDMVKRFADVFDFAYGRYLELRQKEEQNRELTIANAIERVRARALGMQESSEILEVAKLNFEEMTGLGYELWRSDIYISSREEDRLECYFTQDPNATDGLTDDAVIHTTGRLSDIQALEKWPLMKDLWAAIERGERQFTYRLEGDELRGYYSEALDIFFPEQDKEATLARLPAGITDHRFFFNDPSRADGVGGVALMMAEPLDDHGLSVGRRFADAFEFAYSRFCELKEKEEQARQAERRGAVDRVRAEIAAMRSSEDLYEVTPLLWQALTDLGTPFTRCGIMLIDEGDRHVQFFVSNPEGRSLASMDLAFDSHPLVTGSVESWRRGVVYMEQADLREVYESALQQGAAVDRERYLDGQDEAKRVHVHMVPFSQGMIYIGGAEGLGDSDIQMLKEFAAAFSVAYARYMDFQQLEEQNRQLEAANEEIQEATRLKSQFLATMSHELRTPMNAIIGFTRLVLRRGAELLPKRQQENLEKVKLSADHLLNLINDILDLSKIEAGRLDVHAEACDVGKLVIGCCATVGPTLGKSGVELTYEVAGDIGDVHTDEARLRQVVINLLSNALKFTDKGSVSVKALKEQSRVPSPGSAVPDPESPDPSPTLVISVSDTGIGIPEDQMETIFEEFRQVDGTSTRRHQGTGLGLSITKKLVALLGGDLAAESEFGKGSTFTIRIPTHFDPSTIAAASTEDSSHVSRLTSHVPSERETEPNAGMRTVVSIDDDPNVSALLRQELADEGFRVISAHNADEGVALVKRHRPAAVTVDILMPGKDGWQTISMLKADPETRDVPIIVLSAIDNRDLGLAMGVHDYLVKPLDRSALLSALERIDGGGVRDVLVVEDEPATQDMLCQMLEEAGAQPRAAGNGREALDRIGEGVPDAIFLDLMMPEMDGFEVIDRLQGNPEWKDIPVVVVTAKDLTDEEEAYLRERVSRVVQKGDLDEGVGKALKHVMNRSL